MLFHILFCFHSLLCISQTLTLMLQFLHFLLWQFLLNKNHNMLADRLNWLKDACVLLLRKYSNSHLNNISILSIQHFVLWRYCLKHILWFYFCVPVKRAQDKEKLKESEKLKIQVEQLNEFKSRIMESQVTVIVIQLSFP